MERKSLTRGKETRCADHQLISGRSGIDSPLRKDPPEREARATPVVVSDRAKAKWL